MKRSLNRILFLAVVLLSSVSPVLGLTLEQKEKLINAYVAAADKHFTVSDEVGRLRSDLAGIASEQDIKDIISKKYLSELFDEDPTDLFEAAQENLKETKKGARASGFGTFFGDGTGAAGTGASAGPKPKPGTGKKWTRPTGTGSGGTLFDELKEKKKEVEPTTTAPESAKKAPGPKVKEVEGVFALLASMKLKMMQLLYKASGGVDMPGVTPPKPKTDAEVTAWLQKLGKQLGITDKKILEWLGVRYKNNPPEERPYKTEDVLSALRLKQARLQAASLNGGHGWKSIDSAFEILQTYKPDKKDFSVLDPDILKDFKAYHFYAYQYLLEHSPEDALKVKVPDLIKKEIDDRNKDYGYLKSDQTHQTERDEFLIYVVPNKTINYTVTYVDKIAETKAKQDKTIQTDNFIQLMEALDKHYKHQHKKLKEVIENIIKGCMRPLIKDYDVHENAYKKGLMDLRKSGYKEITDKIVANDTSTEEFINFFSKVFAFEQASHVLDYCGPLTLIVLAELIINKKYFKIFHSQADHDDLKKSVVRKVLDIQGNFAQRNYFLPTLLSSAQNYKNKLSQSFQLQYFADPSDRIQNALLLLLCGDEFINNDQFVKADVARILFEYVLDEKCLYSEEISLKPHMVFAFGDRERAYYISIAKGFFDTIARVCLKDVPGYDDAEGVGVAAALAGRRAGVTGSASVGSTSAKASHKVLRSTDISKPFLTNKPAISLYSYESIKSAVQSVAAEEFKTIAEAELKKCKDARDAAWNGWLRDEITQKIKKYTEQKDRLGKKIAENNATIAKFTQACKMDPQFSMAMQFTSLHTDNQEKLLKINRLAQEVIDMKETIGLIMGNLKKLAAEQKKLKSELFFPDRIFALRYLRFKK
ncbi:MAG: hypothetical protein H6679_05560 [Epsilonproteobacteria bacterium]|nr:hypothetical protein [Campylobacterota bacterium]